MAWTLGQVKARVRNLLDDPQGSYLTDDFIVPLIQEVYDDANSQLASTESSYDIALVEVPGIAAGTLNLAAYQAGSGPLSSLTAQPLRIDWKVAGTDASTYQLAANYGVLPDLQPQDSVAGWEYRSNIIWLTPCSIAVDLRIRGEFGALPLSSDDSVLSSHPRIGYVVAYGTAALIAAVRGNEPWVLAYEAKAAEGMDEIMLQLVRMEQGQVRRTGRQTQRGGCRALY
ncbi:MAG TPA: hypothetical protein VGR96_15680 [Acidobacteriaceae bacterium]|nr:hypothetical protein [Acidobacteriaceae bacterium]